MALEEPTDFWTRPPDPANVKDGEFRALDDTTFKFTIPDVWGRGLPPLEVVVVSTALGVVMTALGKSSTILTEEFAALTWPSDDQEQLFRMAAVFQDDVRLLLGGTDAVAEAERVLGEDAQSEEGDINT